MTGKGQVLIIEDDVLFATLMGETLQQEGFSCSVARTLTDALAMLEAGTFDVVVTDIYVPGEQQASALDVLSSRGAASLPIIVITGTPSLDTALQSMDMRAFAYRTKPLQMPDLVATVQEAHREGQVRRRLGQTRERLRQLDAQLDQLRHITQGAPQDGINQSLSEYILLLLGNCGDNLSEAVAAFRLMDTGSLRRPVRHLSRHPEAEMFRRALEHTVQTLERTKHSFKSRELAELRQQLEATLAVARQE